MEAVWKNRDLLIVEGELSRFGVGNDLFDGAASIKRILCPAENAFQKYDEIYHAIVENHVGRLVLLILGPTATVLAYDLACAGVRALDIGNLDMEYEWCKNKAVRQECIKGKYTLEAIGGTTVETISDDLYEKQILTKIGC